MNDQAKEIPLLPADESAKSALGRLQDASIPGVGEILAQAVKPPKPAEAPESGKSTKPADGGDQVALSKSGGKLAAIDHAEHGFKLDFKRDVKTGEINNITTTFDQKTSATTKAPQVYEKKGDVWFYKLPNGQEIQMQGDLRVNEETGEFTQVLRADLDGSGAGKETTRTMDVKGTDTINRMDGSQSKFEFDKAGKMSKWTETDSKGVEKEFLPIKSDKGTAWTNGSDVHYYPKVEDNGNVTYQTPEELGKNIKQIVTSSGDHIINGGNGVKYAFNARGDVTNIQFPSPRLFEQQIVSRIDIRYRQNSNDAIVNQGQIIDRLTLYNAQNQPFKILDRAKDANAKVAQDKWNAFDLQRRTFAGQYVGDFAIKDGLIKTTEPLPTNKAELDKLLASNPNYKTAIEAYKSNPANKDKPAPARMICTYNNSAHIADLSKTNKPSNEEYSVEVFEGDNLNYPVPGEASEMVPVVPPPPPLPQEPPAPVPNAKATPTPVGKPARPLRRSIVSATSDTAIV